MVNGFIPKIIIVLREKQKRSTSKKAAYTKDLPSFKNI